MWSSNFFNSARRAIALNASLGIVKNHTERLTVPGPHAAHAVTKIHTIYPPRTRNRAMMYGEDDRVSAAQRYHFGP